MAAPVRYPKSEPRNAATALPMSLRQLLIRRSGIIWKNASASVGFPSIQPGNAAPQLTECLNYLRDHDGDVLVVWKLDHLGRSVRHGIDTVHNLGERGIAFRSLTEGFDTTTAGGEFLFHVMAALAQMERRVIVERTELALREQGKSLDAIASTLDVGRSSISRALASTSGMN